MIEPDADNPFEQPPTENEKTYLKALYALLRPFVEPITQEEIDEINANPHTFDDVFRELDKLKKTG